MDFPKLMDTPQKFEKNILFIAIISNQKTTFGIIQYVQFYYFYTCYTNIEILTYVIQFSIINVVSIIVSLFLFVHDHPLPGWN